jgi:hypothetical protein
MPKSQNQPLRIYVNDQTVRLLKAVAGLKDSSVNALVNEAIEVWLGLPEQEKLIERHSLDQIEDSEETES